MLAEIPANLNAAHDIRPILLAGCFGLAGTLIPIFISWSKERDVVSQRSRQLDEAIRRVQFWDQWLKLSTVIGDPAEDIARQRVQHELEMLCQLLGGASAQLHSEQVVLKDNTTAYQSKLQNVSFVRRLLLLYRPARNIAWIPRVFFFFFILVTIVGVLVAFSSTPAQRAADLYFATFLLIIAWMFRWLSLWIEKPRKVTSEASPALASPRS